MHARTRRTCARALAGTLAAAALSLTGSGPASAVATKPSDLIGSNAHGAQAVTSLGDSLDEAARRNGMSATALSSLLTGDPTAWLDRTGRVFFKDPAPVSRPAAPAAGAEVAPYPLDQTFALHSNPGSSHTILLDFDGADVTGTAWNDSGVTPGAQPAFSVDLDGSSFNEAERTVIQAIWQAVAEDYAPFDVDVTTQDPGADAITRSGAADERYGTRALISPATQAAAALCSSSCGGIAYLDVFDEPDAPSHAYYQPAWVFSDLQFNDGKNIAEAVSHEVGHNFGLQHDGTSTMGYYTGQGAWAPIMGVGYSKPIVQWSRGDYTDANNHEDDLATIAANGAPLRADETGSDSVATAGAPPAGTAYITSAGDLDVYALGSCEGLVEVAASPAPTSPDLDIALDLLDATGTPVASANPLSAAATSSLATGMAAAIAATVPTGSYFVRVDGVGNGGAATGYDDYASIGAYTLTSSCNAVALPSAPQSLNVTAAEDGRSATVTWAAPALDGGSPLTGYTVGRTGSTPVALDTGTLSHTWENLAPGQSYAFTVAATSAVGTGPVAGLTVTTNDVPGVPTAVAASQDTAAHTATISWAAPSSEGGTPVTGYAVSIDAGDWLAVPAETTTHTFTGLTGRRHEVAVRATNAVGSGNAVSRALLEQASPSSPTLLAATLRPAAGEADVTWAAPLDDGGSPVTGYDVFVDDVLLGQTGPGGTGLTLSGLQRGRTYDLAVRAVNAVGESPFAHLSVTDPATTPSATRIGRAVSGARGGRITATATWRPPTSTGGAAVNGYLVMAYQVNASGKVIRTVRSTVLAAGARSYSMRLPAQGRWRFAVRARNAAGFGPLSARSNTVTAR